MAGSAVGDAAEAEDIGLVGGTVGDGGHADAVDLRD
jgi:hypothetical protein